jgi:hypothetical protein
MADNPLFRPAVVAAAAIFGVSAAVLPARDARADDCNGTTVCPTGRGIAGGALLGAEAVTIVESVAGVHAGWAYGVGALVGAGGGAVGGYFVEQNSSDGKAPAYMLAGGLALVIPALVLTLNATRYRPTEGAAEDNVPTGPAANPGNPAGGVISPTPPNTPGPEAPLPPTSLLDVTTGRHESTVNVSVSLPSVDVRPVYSLAEQRQYGMKAETELRMPVLHVAF